MALVSVIIGTYNRSTLLPNALNSVLEQDYSNLEVIVVDDASTDNTGEVVKQYNDPRIKYVRNEMNQGIAMVSNTGFSFSAGDYIALLGDDDQWIDKNKISKQVNCFMQAGSDNLGLVTTWWEEYNGEENIKKCPMNPQNWPERVLMGGGIICGSAVLIDRKAWLAVNGFDQKQKRGTDSDLFRRIVLAGYKAIIIESITTRVYSAHGLARMSPIDNIKALDNHIETMRYNIEKLQEYYSRYPRALSRYYETIGFSYWDSYLLTNDKKRLTRARDCFLKAFVLNPFRLKSGIKYLLIAFPIGISFFKKYTLKAREKNRRPH